MESKSTRKSLHVPARIVFETSWEVCNKIGGIYTVLTTKAPVLQLHSPDSTIYLGPDMWSEQHPSPWFLAGKIPAWLTKVIKSVKLPYGITVRAGRWLIPSRPIALLIGFQGMSEARNMMYGKMWEWYKVDSLHAYGDYDEGCAFAMASAIVIQQIIANLPIDITKVAQFHEWTTGMGLLLLKHFEPELHTVFTTHATSIGRSICGNNKPLYSELSHYNGDQMARELNMEAKHSLEKAAAREATVFTTVSDITAREAQQLLERRPDVITYNGIDAVIPALTAKRKSARERLLEVASKMKGREYDENTFIIITGGRNEVRNKGLDVFLDSVKTLSELTDRPFLAFVMVPAWSGEMIQDKLLTHKLIQPEHDAIFNKIKALGVERDVIYVPCYLNGDDGMFGMTYRDLLPGADATVFPSYYEPWGYTPLESIAAGVPTITTSLSGFGQWILTTTGNTFTDCGVKVIERDDYNYEQVESEIADCLQELIHTDVKTRRLISRQALATARRALWDNFIQAYYKAYNITD